MITRNSEFTELITYVLRDLVKSFYVEAPYNLAIRGNKRYIFSTDKNRTGINEITPVPQKLRICFTGWLEAFCDFAF